MKKSFFYFVLVILSIVQAYADSPLTSTDFYRAYLDVPIVKEAADHPNNLTKEMMEYLYNDKNPLDIRIALINAVGWNIDGLSTFNDYFDYCQNNIDKQAFLELIEEDPTFSFYENHYNPYEEAKLMEIDENGNHVELQSGTQLDLLFPLVSIDQLAILTYLKAMSNYFDTERNYALMEYAVNFGDINRQSYMLPMGLIRAQTALDMGDWENIFPTMEYYLYTPEIKDVRPKAIEIIMDYINEYKEYADQQ